MAEPMTRNEAEQAIDAVLKNAHHPYFNPDDPAHGKAVEEIKDLFRIAYGENGNG